MKYALPLGILLCLPMLLWATHGHWIDHYRSADGVSCCGMQDCVKVSARLVEDRGTTWRAEVNGTSIVLPKKSVHLSEEPAAYWCHNGEAPCQPPKLENILHAEGGRLSQKKTGHCQKPTYFAGVDKNNH